MKIIFSHGLESGPWGRKIQILSDIAKQSNCSVVSVDYMDTKDPDARAKRLADILKKEQDEFILVGSSMGGYVSLVASIHSTPKAIFLLAPALYMPGYKIQNFTQIKHETEIIHGWSDEIIPVDNSIRHARNRNCTLHLIAGDHRLINSIEGVSVLFKNFLHIQLKDQTQ